MSNEEGDRLRLVSFGTAKAYSLELNQASEAALNRFVATNISLSANTTHRLLPDWANLSGTPLTILVDVGNDGSVDDTLRLQNEFTGTEEQGSLIPDEYRLYQNYPNPFNPVTTIRYGLPQKSAVRLTVYNLLGQEVTTLVNEEREAGYHEVTLNASTLASGAYIYRLTARSLSPTQGRPGNFVQSRKLLLLR